MATYQVTYRVRDDADEPTRNAAEALPTEADLAEVVQNCVDLGLEADLRDAAGFRRGWVHSDGKYKIQ